MQNMECTVIKLSENTAAVMVWCIVSGNVSKCNRCNTLPYR